MLARLPFVALSWAAAPLHTRESAYPPHDDKEHAMPPFLCRPIAPEIRPNTTFWHGGTDARRWRAVGARLRLARRSPDCSAGVECTKSKIRRGLDPNKIGRRECAAGDASFFCANVSASWSAVCRHDIFAA